MRSKPAAVVLLVLSAWTTWYACRVVATREADQEFSAFPVAISARWTPQELEVARLPAARFEEIAAKFRPDRPLPSVNHLLHELANWGVDVSFPSSPEALPGRRMLGILMGEASDNLYRNTEPMLYRGLDGMPRLAKHGEPGSEAHPNCVLATCAALRLPSSAVLRSSSDSVTIAELLRTAKYDFQLTDSIEWTAVALACYGPSTRPWTNRWGQSFDFGSVARHLVSRPLGRGPCAGTHVLHSLTVLLRVNETNRLLSDETSETVRRRLLGAVRLLAGSQRPRGCWDQYWAYAGADANTQPPGPVSDPHALSLVTGHHLEWLHILPKSIPVDPRTLRKAINWCTDSLQTASADAVWDNLCAYSHCFRMARKYAAPAAGPTSRGEADD